MKESIWGLKKIIFRMAKGIKFIANLGASDEIAYHYELICKQWQEDRQLNLERALIGMKRWARVFV